MRFKGTAVLFILLSVLAGWVYLTDIRGREERDRAAEDATKVLPVIPEEIVRITLSYPDLTITGGRMGDVWEFLAPPGLEADSEEWDRLGANLPRVERGDVVSTVPGDLGSFGLEDPVLRLGVALSDGRNEEILFGGENPGGTDNYVKLASSDEVFLSPTSWLSLLRKELDDLRDKTVLRFEEASLDRIEISATNLSLRKENESWHMETPLQTAADDSEVRAFLGALRSARATGFPDPATELPDTGLDRPSVRVVLHDGVGDTDHVLLVGNPTAEDASRYYAQDDSRDVVFIIGNDLVERTGRSSFYWRDKTIASFDRAAVTGISIERAGSTFEIRKSGDDWILDDGRPAAAIEVSLMLNSLEFDRATEIIDSPGGLAGYGLDRPRLRVVFRSDEGDLIRFAFGAQTPDGGSVFWKADGQPEVKAVSNTVFERFNVSAEDIASDSGDADPGAAEFPTVP